jgi:hypothetical protein
MDRSPSRRRYHRCCPDSETELGDYRFGMVRTRGHIIEDDRAKHVGDEVFMLGRFISHSGIKRNQPLARFGNIAMMPGELVEDGRGMRVEAFLVEMRSLSGFSGSPVFVYMGPGTYRGDAKMMPFYSETIGLMGIDTGHTEICAPVLQTGSRSETGLRASLNTGIAVIAPIWKIREVLDEEIFRVERTRSN